MTQTTPRPYPGQKWQHKQYKTLVEVTKLDGANVVVKNARGTTIGMLEEMLREHYEPLT
jgi:hypothetical protein